MTPPEREEVSEELQLLRAINQKVDGIDGRFEDLKKDLKKQATIYGAVSGAASGAIVSVGILAAKIKLGL